MESNFGRDADSARDALDGLHADRDRLAERYERQPAWAVPAQALCVAVLVGSPLAGVGWMSVWAAVAVLGLLGVERAVRRSTGLSVTRPAGPRGIAVLIVLGVLSLALYVVALLAGLGGEDPLIVGAAAAGAFVVTLIGGLLYDRVYVAEVRRAG